MEVLTERICSYTGQPMSTGWVTWNDDYIKFEKDANQWCLDNGYESIGDAYDDDAIYYTEWED